ncbi:MAG TPA: glutathione S-transferase family protein [Pseudomonadales bacterium]|nr:glutathione S-transferase family protein [Pseudomonadales bacterium]
MLVLATTEREYPWGTLRSTHASKVKVILEEKELQYRVERLRPGDIWKKPPEILAKHPLGKVPYLETDKDGVIFDSTVINEYLDDRYPHRSLKPEDAASLARMRMLENFGDEAFLAGDLPRVWMAWWSKPEDRNEESMEAGREGLRKRGLPYLEREITGREYLCDEFSLADAPYMVVAMVLEVDQMDLSDFPNVAAYFDRLRKRPSYRAISAKTSLDDSAGHA